MIGKLDLERVHVPTLSSTAAFVPTMMQKFIVADDLLLPMLEIHILLIYDTSPAFLEVVTQSVRSCLPSIKR